MREIVDGIDSGAFADEWDAERDAGYPELGAMKAAAAGPTSPRSNATCAPASARAPIAENGSGAMSRAADRAWRTVPETDSAPGGPRERPRGHGHHLLRR